MLDVGRGLMQMMSQTERAGMPRPNQGYQGYPYARPAVVDVQELDPEAMAAMARWQHLPRRQVGQNEAGGSGMANAGSARPGQCKQELSDRPVVYIDVPESTSSGISQTREEETEPTFVQETIYYDPFKDRRISVGASEAESEAPQSIAGTSRPAPAPPQSLNLERAGSSSYSSQQTSQRLPPFLSKESFVYGHHNTSSDDGFPLSPIPVSEFPAPPPSYDDIDRPQTVPETTEPPRTVVIVPPSALNDSRQMVQCQYCNAMVKTIVVKQNGFWTHFLAILCVAFLPLIFLIYWCDCTKYKNHYCPACNKKLASENPISRFVSK